MSVATLLLFLLQANLADLPVDGRNPWTSPADIDLGKKMYAGRCAGCHGPAGDGGKGANLAIPSLTRGQTDTALYRVIRYGIPESEMPSHNMTQREIWQLAAFVRTLGRTGSEAIPGDSARGAAVFTGKGGCRNCHLLDGKGGHLGPPLTDLGRRRSPAYIRSKIVNPETEELAGNFSTVTLKTKAGQSISGVLMNQDTFSVQVRDNAMRLHSFWKQDLTQLDIERKTPMPAYGTKLTTQELNDLVSYLARTGGQQ
jgi:cytochrome c oxidase cbb3-type subunit III